MKRLTLKILLITVASVCLAETPGRGFLMRIRDKAVETILQTDNYICTQDLTRFYYLADTAEDSCRQPPELPDTPLRVRDRLKLDVAVSKGTEIYSWHGEQKFSGGSVGQVVREGPISSGGFNGYLRNIFAERGVVFTYRGAADGLIRFDYDVPLNASHYQMQSGRVFVTVPFHGSLAAKPESYELVSLTVIATGEQIPKTVQICAAESKLTYQSIQMAGHQSLVPAHFEMMAGGRSRTFTVSQGDYSSCHEYRGESTVHFDVDDSAGHATESTLTAPEMLKTGLLLQVALKTAIDEDDAYAGEPVEAVLTRKTKLARGKVLPAGAIVRGYITGFQIFEKPYHGVSLRIVFSSISTGNEVYLCHAVHQNPLPMAPRRFDLQSRSVTDETGTLVFNTTHLHLDQGFSGSFVTAMEEESEER